MCAGLPSRVVRFEPGRRAGLPICWRNLPVRREFQDLVVVLAVAAEPDVAVLVDVDAVLVLRPIVAFARAAPGARASCRRCRISAPAARPCSISWRADSSARPFRRRAATRADERSRCGRSGRRQCRRPGRESNCPGAVLARTAPAGTRCGLREYRDAEATVSSAIMIRMALSRWSVWGADLRVSLDQIPLERMRSRPRGGGGGSCPRKRATGSFLRPPFVLVPACEGRSGKGDLTDGRKFRRGLRGCLPNGDSSARIKAYSGLMPALATTPRHFSMSLRMRLCHRRGRAGLGSTPWPPAPPSCRRRLRMSFISRLRRATMAGGRRGRHHQRDPEHRLVAGQARLPRPSARPAAPPSVFAPLVASARSLPGPDVGSEARWWRTACRAGR